MKSKEELRRYRSEIEAEYGRCKVLTAKTDTSSRNCNNTSERVADNDFSWIDYWRAMTGISDTRLFCSSCGKVIFVGNIPPLMEDFYSKTKDNPESHKAFGGHVWVIASKNGKYPGGRYITPLCPACNNKCNEQIPILKGTKLCKELGAHIKDGE